MDVLAILCCPRCQQDLIRTADAFQCASCMTTYPILDGIPRLLPDQYDSYTEVAFETEWNELGEDDVAWGKDAEDRIPELLRYLGYRSADQVRDKRILDVGCGDGTLTEAMASALGAEVVGTDLTRGMLRTHRRPGGRAVFMQAEASHQPFRQASFDIIWSGGALHHTPSTRESFISLPGLLAPGGRIGVWLYGNDLRLSQRTQVAARRWMRELVFKHVNRTTQDLMIEALSHLGMAIQGVGTALGTRHRPVCNRNEKKHKLRDSLTINYEHRHSVAEVAGWFEEAGLRDIHAEMIEGAVVCRGDKAL